MYDKMNERKFFQSGKINRPRFLEGFISVLYVDYTFYLAKLMLSWHNLKLLECYTGLNYASKPFKSGLN